MNRNPEHELWARAATRHGLLTRDEIVALVGTSGLRRLLVAGFLERLQRGIYRVRAAPVTERQRLLGIVLAAGGYASHQTRGALEGLDYCTFNKFHILRDVGGTPSRKLEDVKVVRHRTNFLPAHHVEVVDGVSATTLVRALCDMSATMSVDRLEKVVDACKRKDLLDYNELAQCREEIRAQGRRRTSVLDEILAERVSGYLIGETPPEDKVILWVAEAGFEPKPQHWALANGNRRRIDVAVVDDRVAVEYQGLKEHATGSAVINDSEKITDLQLAGWFVVLVTKKTTKANFLRDLRRAVEIQRQARGEF